MLMSTMGAGAVDAIDMGAYTELHSYHYKREFGFRVYLLGAIGNIFAANYVRQNTKK